MSTDSIQQRFAATRYEFPVPSQPAGRYRSFTASSAGLLFVSGQVPIVEGQLGWRGIVGIDLDEQEACVAAERAVLQALAQLVDAGATASNTRVLRMVVYVASAPHFTSQVTVADAASAVLAAALDDGAHARSAIGVAVLPLGAPVEVEVTAELLP